MTRLGVSALLLTPSRSVLDAVRLLARPAISRGLWWRLEGPLEKASVEFTNGKRPRVRSLNALAKSTELGENGSTFPRPTKGKPR